MKLARTQFVQSAALLFLSFALTPALAHAQAGAGGGRGQGAASIGQMSEQLKQILGQLNLTTDQQSRITDILKQTTSDVKEASKGLQNLPKDEAQQKRQEIAKMIADARLKVEAELTSEQKIKYYPLMASTGLKRLTDYVAALKAAAAKIDATDDQKKQLKDLTDNDDKTLADMKTQAEAVKDQAGAESFTKNLGTLQNENRKQIVTILGQDDGRKLVQEVQQSMRANSDGPRTRRGDAANTPASQPAAK